MAVLFFLLVLAGFIFFVLAAFGVTFHPRISLLAIGLACWILVDVIVRLQTLP